VIDTVQNSDGSGWAIVKHVAGSPLDEVVKAGSPLPPEVAVMIGIDLADALVGLHQRGGAHGLIRPAAVIVKPEDYSTAVLACAPPAPSPNPYRLPEPSEEGPSPQGDVWALAGVVHFMLLGEPPPVYGYPSRALVPQSRLPGDLVDFLAACLAQKPVERVSTAHSLRDMLACSRANSLRPGAFSGQPPPPQVVVPGPLPRPADLSPPGPLAPAPTPLASPGIQHITIPKPELAPSRPRGPWLVLALVGVGVMLVGVAVLVLLSLR
jgi:serine/threonine protein kinase